MAFPLIPVIIAGGGGILASQLFGGGGNDSAPVNVSVGGDVTPTQPMRVPWMTIGIVAAGAVGTYLLVTRRA